MLGKTALAVFLCSLAVGFCSATIFGSVRGIIHDPQHRPVPGAMVMLRSNSSDWAKATNTNDNGEFEFNAVPIGEYTVVVAAPGFDQISQMVTVRSGTEPVLHLALNVAAKNETVNVSGAPEVAPIDSPTPTTLVDREQIERTPGADRTNSLAFITDYVPGAYVTHNQMHIRGGHQVTWLVDGVPVPNTNIADTVGPQFDPKDIDYLEVQRGGYSAEYGDRTYGIFNVVPRSGFERQREGELLFSFGNFHQTNEQLSFGSHTINARCETVSTQPSFRDAFKARRCLVPVNAFYEWSGPKGHRTKWRIRVKDEEIFSLAGLWEWWRDPESREAVETYTIITTAANEAIAKLLDARIGERRRDPSAEGLDLLARGRIAGEEPIGEAQRAEGERPRRGGAARCPSACCARRATRTPGRR